MSLLDDTLGLVQPLDAAAMAQAWARQNNLTKPPGSLGRLEALSVQIAGIARQAAPSVARKTIIVMAADHGVTQEGVTHNPPEITCQMIYNFLAGGAAISVLARMVGASLRVVDMGVAADVKPGPDLIQAKIARGTANMARGPAMTRAQAVQAIEAGILSVGQAAREGLDLLGTGDMGIGNTTASSAIAAVMTGRPVPEVTGRGAGIDDAMLQHKVAVIEQAIALNRPRADDPLDVLSKVGGFEIGGIAGLILGAAALRIPVVIDGFIAGAGALIALGLHPGAKDYVIAGHRSHESGHAIVLRHLQLNPVLELDLRLGEGTGAALAMTIVEAAVRLLNEMATFTDAGVTKAK